MRNINFILDNFYEELEKQKNNRFVEELKENNSKFRINFDRRIKRIIKADPKFKNYVEDILKTLIKSNHKINDWSGHYSELVVLDVLSQSQYNDKLSFFQKISQQDQRFKNSFAAKKGKHEIDLDLSFEIRGEKTIYADIKSLIPTVLEILNEKIYSLEKKHNVLIGIKDYIPYPYNDIKSHLNKFEYEVKNQLEKAINKNEKNINISIDKGYEFNFEISYNGNLSYCPNIVFDPYREALCDADKCLEHWKKILPNDYSFIVYVTNPLFSFSRYINPFDNEILKVYFRSFARRVFIERRKNILTIDGIKSDEISQGFAGIIFIYDNSSETIIKNKLYDCFIYLNPNYNAKKPLTECDCNYIINNSYFKNIDDFKYDNY